MPETLKFFLTLAGILAIFAAGMLLAVIAEANDWRARRTIVGAWTLLRSGHRGGIVPGAEHVQSVHEAYLENTADWRLAWPDQDLRFKAREVYRTASENAIAAAAATTAPSLHLVPLTDEQRKPVFYHFDQQMHDPEENR